MWCVHVADGKLQEQLSAVRKEITRLEYQNNELDKVRPRPPLPAPRGLGQNATSHDFPCVCRNMRLF